MDLPCMYACGGKVHDYAIEWVCITHSCGWRWVGGGIGTGEREGMCKMGGREGSHVVGKKSLYVAIQGC